MLAYQFVQFLAVVAFVNKVDFHHVHITEVVEVVVLVPNVCHSTAHTGSKVASGFAQHYHATARHILTAVSPAPSMTLLHPSFSLRSALPPFRLYTIRRLLHHIIRISGNDVVLSLKVTAHRRQYGYAPAAESLGKIVVGLALELETYTAYEECSETLSGTALKLMLMVESGSPSYPYFPAIIPLSIVPTARSVFFIA